MKILAIKVAECEVILEGSTINGRTYMSIVHP